MRLIPQLIAFAVLTVLVFASPQPENTKRGIGFVELYLRVGFNDAHEYFVFSPPNQPNVCGSFDDSQFRALKGTVKGFLGEKGTSCTLFSGFGCQGDELLLDSTVTSVFFSDLGTVGWADKALSIFCTLV